MYTPYIIFIYVGLKLTTAEYNRLSLVKTISALKTTKFKTFLVLSLTVNFHLSFKYNVQILTIILPEILQD